MAKIAKLKPLSLGKTFLYFIIPAAILYTTHYYLIPNYIAFSGAPYFVGYLIGYISTMGLFFFAALAAYHREGYPFNWAALAARFRLNKIRKADWIWAAVLIAAALAAYFSLAFTGDWVNSIPLLAPRPAWPAEFGPNGTANLEPGVFMGLALKGQWWVIPAFFLGWFFNIFGEELWFRGCLLPRQELVFGKAAWAVNALAFVFTHIWQPWVILAILPSSLLVVYIVQVRKNTWISILQHGLMNISLLFFLIGGVIG